MTMDQRAQIEQARRVRIDQLIDTGTMRRAGREYSGPCPLCGDGEDRFYVVPARNVWGCRYCAAGYHDAIEWQRRREGSSFWEAVEALTGGELPRVTRAQAARQARRYDDWQPPRWSHPAVLARLTRHPRRIALWQQYKPLARATIEARMLGIGRVPGQGICPHERLIVPVWEDGTLTNLRGRRIDCGCDAKWLTAGGGKPAIYGLERLQRDAVVWVVENHIDGLLLEERYGWQALSPTAPTMHWAASTVERLLAARPKQVVVVGDNDPGGQVAARRNATRLATAGLPVRMWEWPTDAPHGADIGWMIQQQEAA